MPIITQKLSTAIKGRMAQTEAAGQKQAALRVAVGNTVVETTPSTETALCKTTVGAQEAAVGATASKALVGKMEQFSKGVGAGTKADSSSPAYIATEVNDLCQIGFLDTSGSGRYGELPNKMGCNTSLQGTRYIDADMKLSSVIDRLQYPLPQTAHVKKTDDGHISFIGATKDDTYGTGSELDFVAAWKFCEHLQPVLPTPTHNSGTPGIADVVSIKADRSEMALRTSAASECFRALAYRTACPRESKDALKDSGVAGSDCYTTQQALCKRLTATHKEGGYELTLSGDDPIYENTLAHCEESKGGVGISLAMYDAIMARRCHDVKYVADLASRHGGSQGAAEHAVAFDCPAQEMAYQKYMDAEQKRLQKMVRILLQMSGMGGGDSSSTARIAK